MLVLGEYASRPVGRVLAKIYIVAIASRAVTESLFRHVNEVLDEQHGLLILYGAYKIEGQFSAESDQAVSLCSSSRLVFHLMRHLHPLASLMPASEPEMRGLGFGTWRPSKGWHQNVACVWERGQSFVTYNPVVYKLKPYQTCPSKQQLAARFPKVREVSRETRTKRSTRALAIEILEDVNYTFVLTIGHTKLCYSNDILSEGDLLALQID